MAEDETSWILLEQLIILSPQSPQQQTKLHLRIYVLLLLLEHVAVMLILTLIELLGLVHQKSGQNSIIYHLSVDVLQAGVAEAVAHSLFGGLMLFSSHFGNLVFGCLW